MICFNVADLFYVGDFPYSAIKFDVEFDNLLIILFLP